MCKDFATAIANEQRILDIVKELPRSKTVWRKRRVSDILGCCVHHSGGVSTKSAVPTAEYHTSRYNHITYGHPLPSICYHFVITDNGSICYTADIRWRVYAQGSEKSPGDENTHLVSVLVLGDFKGPANDGRLDGPTPQQMESLTFLVAWLCDKLEFGPEGVFGHYHFGKAQCPGYVLSNYVEDLRSSIAPPNLLDTDKKWQQALLVWRPDCLPKYGADGSWGTESKRALVRFQRDKGMKLTGMKDPFTQLRLIKMLKGKK